MMKFVDKISEEMASWPNLEYPAFGSNVINREKWVSKDKIIQIFVLSLKVKSEHPV